MLWKHHFCECKKGRELVREGLRRVCIFSPPLRHSHVPFLYSGVHRERVKSTTPPRSMGRS